MTATVFEVKRFAVHDGDGIRTTVFFKGCHPRDDLGSSRGIMNIKKYRAEVVQVHSYSVFTLFLGYQAGQFFYVAKRVKISFSELAAIAKQIAFFGISDHNLPH